MSDTTPLSLSKHSSYLNEYHKRLLRYGQPYIVASQIIEPYLRKIVEQGAFYLRIHRETLPMVLDSKRIKSQMETGDGTTMGGPETRREVTAELFGADIRKMKKADYPKYGYLSCDDSRLELFSGGEMEYQYGNVLIKLKKERLMHRTTMTVGTSLFMGVSRHLVPTRVDDIKATCIPGVENDPKALLNPRCIEFYMFFAHAITSKRITTDNFYRISETLGNAITTFTCFELQYHGPLTIEDIERIDVYSEDDDEYLEDMAARCAELGIPFEVRTLL